MVVERARLRFDTKKRFLAFCKKNINHRPVTPQTSRPIKANSSSER
jgi:hypothetical protein